MEKINKIHARQILDSRGNPTLEVDVTIDGSVIGRASVPSGASTGIFEALELRDQDMSLYNGKSVYKAIENVNTIIHNSLAGHPAKSQEEIDNILVNLDGTPNRSRLGANAILGTSLAYAKASAAVQKLELYQYFENENLRPPTTSNADIFIEQTSEQKQSQYHNSSIQDKYILPLPMMNIINGGCHADNCLDIQEYMIIPHNMGNFSETLRAGAEIFHQLGRLLQDRGYPINVGDEGGYAPSLKSDIQALDLILEAIEAAGYKPDTQVSIAIDAASSEFYDKENKVYLLSQSDKALTSDMMVEYWSDIIAKYPIISLEDPMAEEDWHGWQSLNQQLGEKIKLIGDDLYCTNIHRLRKGIENNASNGILIKMNQIGTITETIQTFKEAQNNKYSTVISHRSGETEDTSIADLAVGLGAGLIKTGSLSRTDRIAKYNRLLRIEEQVGNRGKLCKL